MQKPKHRNLILYIPVKYEKRNGRKSDTKISMLTNLEEGNDSTESINRALRMMRFAIHTVLKRTPFELHHGRKRRTELLNKIKYAKT